MFLNKRIKSRAEQIKTPLLDEYSITRCEKIAHDLCKKAWSVNNAKSSTKLQQSSCYFCGSETWGMTKSIKKTVGILEIAY